MKELFFNFLKKVFDIRDGEFMRACLMQLIFFLSISTLLIVKPTVNGLFLSEVGIEYLPVAFVLVAIFAVIISTIYSKLLGRATLIRIILITLGISVLLFVLFGFLMRFNIAGKWILYAFYIWVAIFGVLTASQFWILANVVFNAREAKRLFGFIGAGAIAGGIFGGYVTTLLAEWLGSETLPFVAAGLLFFCMPISHFIWKKSVLNTQSKFQRRKKIPVAEHPFQLIKKSPHLKNLAGIIAISVIVAKLVDYQFSAIASSKIPDPDELTAFFGFWFSTFNVVSLTIQLLLTRRVVGTLGVGTSLFIQPTAIFAGAVLVFFIPELIAAVFIKLSDGSLKQSINKAAVELLALPVPAEIKSRTKTFIDVVVDSIATGISGLLLIFVVNGLDLPVGAISIMIASLILFWLFFVLKVRKSYLDAFRINLKRVHHNGEDQLDLSNASVVADIKKVLEEGSEPQIKYLLTKLKAQPDDRFSAEIAKLLSHTSDDIKESAIRNLYFLKSRNFSDIITPLMKTSSQKVKIAAFDYLLKYAPQGVDSLVETYLNYGDYKISLAALVGLAEESRDNTVLKQKFNLELRLRELHQSLDGISDHSRKDFHKIGLLKALGMAKLPDLFPLIMDYFHDSNPKVAIQALLSAGDTMHPHFIGDLIDFLGHEDLGQYSAEALIKYGKEIIHPLNEYILNKDAKPEVLHMIPVVMERFDSQLTVDSLQILLKNKSGRVRLETLRALSTLKARNNFLNFHQKDIIRILLKEAGLYQDTLSVLYVQVKTKNKDHGPDQAEKVMNARLQLIQLLEKRLDRNLERIFRLLGLKYSPEDLISIYEGIQTREPDMRVNALEFLDNLLGPGLKKVLIPIVETAFLDNITEDAIRHLNVKIPKETEAYQILLTIEDEEVQKTARTLVDALQIK